MGKLISNKVLCWHKEKGLFWYRLFGYGLFFKNILVHERMFSERYGKLSYLKIRKWLIRPVF